MRARVVLKRGSPTWSMWWRAMSGAARGEETQQRLSYDRIRYKEEDVKKTMVEVVPVDKAVRAFQRHVPIEEAATPPSAWYTDVGFAELEMRRVFGRGWQAVGHVHQVEKPGSFFAVWGTYVMWFVKTKRGKFERFTTSVDTMLRLWRQALGAHVLSSARTIRDGRMDWTGGCRRLLDLQASATSQPETMGYCLSE